MFLFPVETSVVKVLCKYDLDLVKSRLESLRNERENRGPKPKEPQTPLLKTCCAHYQTHHILLPYCILMAIASIHSTKYSSSISAGDNRTLFVCLTMLWKHQNPTVHDSCFPVVVFYGHKSFPNLVAPSMIS